MINLKIKTTVSTLSTHLMFRTAFWRGKSRMEIFSVDNRTQGR